MGAEWRDRMVAGRFADFVIDNIDLAQQFVSFFSSPAKVWIPLPS